MAQSGPPWENLRLKRPEKISDQNGPARPEKHTPGFTSLSQDLDMANEVTCEDSDSESDIEFTSPPRKNIRTDRREGSLSSAAERHRLDPYYLGEDASSGIVYYV